MALEGFGLAKTVDIRPFESRRESRFTPGFQNANVASLPPFPTIRINELQTQNAGGFSDAAGDADPWLELYNYGTEPASLSALHLSPDYNHPALWKFPEEAVLRPGEYRIVWLDGELEENAANEWHASFRPQEGNGSLALSHSANGQAVIIDHINYPEILIGQSLGLLPDGQANSQQRFPTPTPGAANTRRLPEINVFINEWMAQNTATIADPADPSGAEFDDWFELYNAGNDPADLSGLFLSDDTDNPDRFPIPPGYVIAPRGFLLVWADGQPEQNGLTADLHVNFKLSRNGESIGLYRPGGEVVDLVQFEPQTDDVAEGRDPDGTGGSFLPLPNPSPGTSNTGFLLTITEIQWTPDGQFRIAFTTQPGKRYQARYIDTLDRPEWRDLGEPILAESSNTTIADPSPPSQTQRFYTIQQLE